VTAASKSGGSRVVNDRHVSDGGNQNQRVNGDVGRASAHASVTSQTVTEMEIGLWVMVKWVTIFGRVTWVMGHC